MKTFTKFLVGALAAVAIFASAASAAYTHTGLLKMGMTNSQVMSLQQTLNGGGFLVSTTGAGSPGMESMYFGAKTKAAVMSFQMAKGLSADGVVGAQTGTALAAMTGGSVSYPAGCSSTSGYSTTTGMPCSTTANLPAGCSSTSGYSSTTGQACSGGTTTNPNPSTGALSGGAADIEVTKTSTDVEDEVREGEEDVAIAGFEVEADGGDVAVTSVRVSFAKTTSDTDSDRFDHYIDEVSVWLGDTKVGSADAEDFSRDTGTTPTDTYTETIQLSNAVVREGDEEKFYVAVSAVESIDTDEQNARFNTDIETVRFTDSTGAILTDEVSYTLESFGFEDSSEGNELTLKSSSANPDDMTVKVDEDDESEEILALVARLENDEDSSDAELFDIPVFVRIQDAGSAVTAEDVIDMVMVSVGGEEYEADLVGAGTLDGDDDTTVEYSLDIDGDVTLDAGDEVDVKVYITFNDQGDDEENFADNTVVTASIDPDEIDAEGEDDEIDVEGGTQTGADLTLNLSAASVDSFDWQVGGGATGGNIDFFFTVETEDEDFDVLLSSITANDTVTNNGTTNTSVTLTRVSGDATDNGGGSFTVNEGDDARFRVRYVFTGSDGDSAEVTIESAAGQEVPDEDQLSPTVYLNS